MAPSDDLLAAHHVLVPGDNLFQRAARLRQALWREAMDYPIGEHQGRPLGSRLAMPFAQETLANYINEPIRAVVRTELGKASGNGKLYREPRIFNDLLSSQPLCFNLFAELQADRNLASRVLGELEGAPDLCVDGIEFEHSPGRGDPSFTGDHSAFDIFVTYHRGANVGFFGVEVKYAENMAQAAARFRPRYLEVALGAGIFREDRLPEIRRAPLEQLWRDHLLVASLWRHPSGRFHGGQFVVLFAEENLAVQDAVRRYRDCLRDDASFKVWTLERFLRAVQTNGAGALADAIQQRYLNVGIADR